MIESSTRPVIDRPSRAGLVSIIIPAYNRERCIERAIDSVVAQDYRPIECIVVDDGSTDGTWAILSALAQTTVDGCTVRCFQQENGGAPVARNRGVRESKGALIAFLDSDDCLLPDAIRRRVEVLEHSAFDYCYDRGARMGPGGEVLGHFGVPWPSDPSEAIIKYLFHTNAPLMRRELCLRIGPWNESLAGLQEIEYFSRLKIIGGEGAFIDEVGHEEHEYGEGRIVGSGPHRKATLPAHIAILQNLQEANDLRLMRAIKYYRDDVRWRYVVSAERYAFFGQFAQCRKMMTAALALGDSSRESVVLSITGPRFLRPVLFVYFVTVRIMRSIILFARSRHRRGSLATKSSGEPDGRL